MLSPEWHSEYEYVTTPGRMVRGPRYKYTHYLEGNGEELYDMKKDPGERKNLAKDPKYSKILAEHSLCWTINSHVPKMINRV